MRLLARRREARPGLDTRRPVSLASMAEVTSVSTDRVIPVIEVFRQPDRCFLTPPSGVPLQPNTVIDISHESLVRQWQRMNDWVRDEAESAATYRRLAESARLFERRRTALLVPPELDVALAWSAGGHNAAWAARYDYSFEQLPRSAPFRFEVIRRLDDKVTSSTAAYLNDSRFPVDKEAQAKVAELLDQYERAFPKSRTLVELRRRVNARLADKASIDLTDYLAKYLVKAKPATSPAGQSTNYVVPEKPTKAIDVTDVSQGATKHDSIKPGQHTQDVLVVMIQKTLHRGPPFPNQ